ncbi:MAG TPA: hypothetical protein VG649_16585 [Candidatus Angelobacter sp.]|jgi:hypothetical protein|nr:hypothetical protein [Candidatus Angelobacter sp.]
MLRQDYLVGMVGLCLQIALLCLLTRRKIYHRFPFFFAYSVYWTVAIAVQAVAQSLFFAIYYVTEIGDGVLALLAIYAVLRSAYEERQESPRWLIVVPSLIAVILLADSLWEAFFYPLGRGQWVHMAAGIYSFNRNVLCLEIAALIFALAVDWRRHDPIRWGRYRFGIIVGFGAPAIITLVAQLLRTYFGVRYEEAFRYMPSGAYFGQMLIWLRCFFRDEAHGTQVIREGEVSSGGESGEPGNRSLQTFTVLPF